MYKLSENNMRGIVFCTCVCKRKEKAWRAEGFERLN